MANRRLPADALDMHLSKISNMAEYDLALRYFTVLPIAVPTMVLGLIAG